MFEGVGIAAAAIGAAGSIGGGIASGKGAASAASDQEQAAEQQIQLQQSEFDTEQGELKPWMSAGSTALQALTKGLAPGGQFTQQFTANNFTSSPAFAGYNFQQQQGQDAINASAASKGQTYSPGTAAALSKYNQGLASTDYQNYYNQAYEQWLNQQKTELGGLTTVAGFGQGGTEASVNATQAATNNELTSLGNIGNAQAGAATGITNAVNSGLGGIEQNILNASTYGSTFGQGSFSPTINGQSATQAGLETLNAQDIGSDFNYSQLDPALATS